MNVKEVCRVVWPHDRNEWAVPVKMAFTLQVL
jgi:hypothetical protein